MGRDPLETWGSLEHLPDAQVAREVAAMTLPCLPPRVIVRIK